MNEIIQIAMDYAGRVWKRRWYAASLAWLVCLVGWVIVATLPDQYRSQARIFISTESMLTPLMKGMAVPSDARRKVAEVQSLLKTQGNLEKLARMTDMDLRATNEVEMREVIGKLRRGVVIRGGQSAFMTVSFADEDPELAKRVVSSVLTIFVESNLGQNRRDMDQTRRFLDEQIQDYERQLEAAEQRRADFRRQYLGYLPGDGSNFDALQSQKGELGKIREQITETQSMLAELERQLASVPAMVEVTAGQRGRSRVELRVAQIQTQIDELMLRYTPKHPDILRLQRTIEMLRTQGEPDTAAAPAAKDLSVKGAEVDVAKAETGSEVDAAGEAQPARMSPNPLFEKLKFQVIQERGELAKLKERESRTGRQIEGTQRKIDAVPGVEVEYAKLNRDYGILKKNYDQLLARREQARMSQTLESKTDTVEFRVVDPPVTPRKPVGPDRPLIISGTMAGGLIAGIALAVALSIFDSSFGSVGRLRAAFDVPVLGSVSFVLPADEGRRRTVEMFSFGLTAICLICAFAALITIELMHLSNSGLAT